MSRNELLIDYSPLSKAIRDARVMKESEAISRLIQIENKLLIKVRLAIKALWV